MTPDDNQPLVGKIVKNGKGVPDLAESVAGLDALNALNTMVNSTLDYLKLREEEQTKRAKLGVYEATELRKIEAAESVLSHSSTRTRLRALRIKHTIPERSDQIGRRKARGSAGGRPPAFDSRMYVHRNTVERGFNRLKQWRGIATRYDKWREVFWCARTPI